VYPHSAGSHQCLRFPVCACLPGPQFEFSEDPLLASLDYLHDAARRAGRLPHYSGAVQAAVSAEERLYKERLARAHFARWAAGACWWGCDHSNLFAGGGLCFATALTAGLVGQAWLPQDR
jgi:anaerobic glycerol-3-phosphate dehydrogenase